MTTRRIDPWRRDFPVLVPDAHALGSLGVIRSLGRCGYPVIAAAADLSAIGLKSAYARTRLVYPPQESPAFVPWLRKTISDDGVRAIVPSEGVLHAIRSDFEEFAPLLPLTRDHQAVYSQLSKYDLFRRLVAEGRMAHLPRLAFVDDTLDDATLLEVQALGYPQFAKFDALHAREGAARDNVVLKLSGPDQAEAILREHLHRYHRGVVQGYCGGVGVGVFLLRWNGEELAHFMHRRLHEVPYTGGASSYRCAWHHDAILADARAHAKTLDYQGVGMFEYRWEPDTDRFHLIELNARFWGSLHLALHAGVDFPRLLLDAFFGHPERCWTYDRTTRCRSVFPGEIDYVRSCLRARALPLSVKAWAALEFALLGLDPKVRADYWFAGDRLLYFRQVVNAARKYLR